MTHTLWRQHTVHSFNVVSLTFSYALIPDQKLKTNGLKFLFFTLCTPHTQKCVIITKCWEARMQDVHSINADIADFLSLFFVPIFMPYLCHGLGVKFSYFLFFFCFFFCSVFICLVVTFHFLSLSVFCPFSVYTSVLFVNSCVLITLCQSICL